MDLAEAVYMIEQRAGAGGHFSYRRAAYQMHHELCQRYPYLASAIRIPEFDEANDLLKR
jgi:hypothetical protein